GRIAAAGDEQAAVGGEGQGLSRGTVAAVAVPLPQRRGFPDADRTVGARRRQQFAIGGEGQGQDPAGGVGGELELGGHLAGQGTAQAHGIVPVIGNGQQGAVRGEGDTAASAGEVPQRPAFDAVAGVPQADGIAIGGDQPLAVGGEGDTGTAPTPPPHHPPPTPPPPPPPPAPPPPTPP